MSRLIIEKQAAIQIIRFTNPPHNYMDDQTIDEFTAFLDDIESDHSVRVVILTGEESDVFIRHFDVSVLLDRSQKLAERGLTFSIDRPVPETVLHRCFRRMENMPVIFIAAINGTAMGGGFEFALACDFRLVKQGPYDLGLPEINLGILAGAGGTQRLPRLIGQAKALEMQLLGKTISPDEAVAFGVAMECVDGSDEKLVDRAIEIATKLCEKSPKASAHIKRLIRGCFDWGLDEGLAKERTLFCDLMVDDRGLQGMSSMVSGDRDILDPDVSASKLFEKT